MLKYIIYLSSYPFIVLVFWRLSLGEKRKATDTLFLIGVTLVPIGKLFYMPVPGLVSVTMAFIFTTIVGGMTLTVNFIRGIDRFVLVPFVALIPAMLSIIFLYDNSQATFITTHGSVSLGGSPIMRLAALFLNCVYGAYVTLMVSKETDGRRDVATWYIWGTLFAVLMGAFITYGVYYGQLSSYDLMPISVDDVHIVGRIFRFNPGSSVNEFGEILGYAIFMLRWTGWKTKWKLLAAGAMSIAELLSFTRGAWLALIVGYFFYALFTARKQRNQIMLTGAIVVAAVAFIIATSDVLRFILLSRLSFESSPGENDRLTTATAIFQAITASPLRMFFGYGWSADIFSPAYGFDKVGYVHSVPLMFLFDTGLLGVFFCALVFTVLGKFVYTHVKQDMDIFVGMVAFMFSVSAFEHIFFHVQTWLIFGLILGIALRSARQSAPGYKKAAIPKQAVS